MAAWPRRTSRPTAAVATCEGRHQAGLPYFACATITGLRRPRHPVPGIDLAGTVEAVGSSASRFAPGDAVFGQVAPPNKQWVNAGTFAEFAAAPEAVLVRVPDDLSFEEAAGIPAHRD